MCYRVKGGLDNAMGGLLREGETDPHYQSDTCLSTL